MNIDREFALAEARVRRRIDDNVASALARIARYTPTEQAEVEAGLRDSETVASMKRAAVGFEALGEAWASLVAGARAAVEAFNRGFESWGKR